MSILVIAIPVYAKPAGKSSIEQLDLVEKDSEWKVVEDGAVGKLTFNTAKSKFVFNGHGLEAGTEYALINFAREGTVWPATIKVLGEGTANNGGNVHITGTCIYDDLDPDTTDSPSEESYKIWLVLSGDITGEKLALWNPEDYLFEFELI